MTSSPARRSFKEMLGQNNHFLITIMIGLDAVANGTAHRKEEFSTSWDPRNAVQSARRSREFACKALAAWLVDALTAYVRNLSSTPNTIIDSRLTEIIRTNESVEDKISVLARACQQENSVPTMLTRVAVVWRNRLVHHQARNKIDSRLMAMLRGHATDIATDYCGLDIERLLDSVDKSHAPTFKEVTSLVHSAHDFVRLTDAWLLEHSDLDSYVRQVLAHYVSEDPVVRISNIWGKDEHRRLVSLIQICKQYGMTSDDPSAFNHTSEGTLEEIIKWSPAQAKANLVHPAGSSM